MCTYRVVCVICSQRRSRMARTTKKKAKRRTTTKKRRTRAHSSAVSATRTFQRSFDSATAFVLHCRQLLHFDVLGTVHNMYVIVQQGIFLCIFRGGSGSCVTWPVPTWGRSGVSTDATTRIAPWRRNTFNPFNVI